MPNIPVYHVDLYGDEAILDPFPHYKAIRDLGPVVHLPASDVFAVSRFEDVRTVLRDNKTFISSKGVALNKVLNDMSGGATVTTDAPRHTQIRNVLMRPLLPGALTEIKAQIQSTADELVKRLAAQDKFDGIKDFAQFLPVSIVATLTGLPEEGRDAMLDWASGSFDAMGPDNARSQKGLMTAGGQFAYLQTISRDKLRPDSWADKIYQALDAGEIDEAALFGLLVDYTTPSLDTTISGICQFLFHLGQNPDQWALVRKDPKLIRGVVEESLRLDSPIRGFTRVAATDAEISGVTVPENSRILVLYGSANRDERFWEEPDTFNVLRSNLGKQMAFGNGIHQCAGQHLARLEMTSLLEAMVRHVDDIELHDFEIGLHNTLRIFSRLQASFSGK